MESASAPPAVNSGYVYAVMWDNVDDERPTESKGSCDHYPPGGVQSIVMSMPVCLSVCLSVHITQKPHG